MPSYVSYLFSGIIVGVNDDITLSTKYAPVLAIVNTAAEVIGSVLNVKAVATTGNILGAHLTTVSLAFSKLVSAYRIDF